MKKQITIISFIAVLAFGMYFYYSPYAAVKAMRDAAETGDAVLLSHYVDFPSVRESLKSSLNAKLAAETIKNKSSNPFEAFGTAIATAFVNQLIDTLATPQGLAAMMKGEKSKITQREPTTFSGSTSPVIVDMSYAGLNCFLVKVSKKNDEHEEVNLEFTRAGLLNWQLSAVRFPA